MGASLWASPQVPGAKPPLCSAMSANRLLLSGIHTNTSYTKVNIPAQRPGFLTAYTTSPMNWSFKGWVWARGIALCVRPWSCPHHHTQVISPRLIFRRKQHPSLGTGQEEYLWIWILWDREKRSWSENSTFKFINNMKELIYTHIYIYVYMCVYMYIE